MASLADDFAFVAASAQRAARQQRAACEEVLADPDSRGHALATHLQLAYEAIEQRITERETHFSQLPDDATAKEDAIVEMRKLLWDVRKLQSNLSWLDAAQEPPLDLGTTYFIESACRALVAPQVEVTLVSAEETSYATTSNPWEPVISGWGGGIPADEPTVVVVLLPRREERTGLLHPLIVHELGHAADEEHSLVEGIWQDARNRVRLRRRFSQAVSDFSSAQGVDQQTAADHIGRRLLAWIAEALCDCIATLHLGPTYLYSFLAEVAPGNMDVALPQHPPTSQRIRLILENLERLGWKDAISSAAPDLNTWAREKAASTTRYVEVDGFLTWAIDDLRAVVRNKATRHLHSRVFQPDVDELAEVESLLSARIPPAQRQELQPIRREAIMLGCWHAALGEVGGGIQRLPDAADTEELQEILPAALELSALAQAWKETS